MEDPSRFLSPCLTVPSTLFPPSLFYPPAPLTVMRPRLYLARREHLLRCSMHRPVNGVHIAPPQKREANSRGPHGIAIYSSYVIFEFEWVSRGIIIDGYRRSRN